MSINFEDIEKQAQSEEGSMRNLFLLLSIVSILGLKEHWSKIESVLPLYFQITLLGLVAMLVITTALVSLHAILSGEKSPRQMKKTIWKEQKKLRVFLKEAKKHLAQLKDEASRRSGVLSAESVEELAIAHSMISALENRITRVHEYQSYGDIDSVAYAYNLMFSDVTPQDDAMTSLIQTSKYVAVPYTDLKKDMTERLKTIKAGLPNGRVKRPRLATAH